MRLEQFSHDRNVEIILEQEAPETTAPGTNSDPGDAEFIGELAAHEYGGDDNLRLGFEIHGLLNAANDLDVYSFTAEAGTEVWFDIDRTSFSLNTIVELIDADGNVVARSDDSVAEYDDPSLLFRSAAVLDTDVNPIQKQAIEFQALHASGIPKDHFSQNTLDAAMRVVLPGAVGTRTTYHVRVRSFGEDIEDLSAGRTSGVYQLQIRLNEADQFPGSTVRNSEIRYAIHGVEVRGLPGHSPLVGETAEDEEVGGPETNNTVIPDTRLFCRGPRQRPAGSG